ncbi:uncharacterized protein LOC112555062 [Pomacea canaliculata]|uniref:uncharacterized protein LOC112555062 n=1 Tax=Pomacea canaliculata TaxID=400727 RepID=UPI000D732C4C|nr:uncharacterized protein LOC112555062 [Pomacea canaliculata]
MDMTPRRTQSAKKPRLRFVDLSLDGAELGKKAESDNGKFPLGGYKKSKRSPIGIYSYDKPRDYQHQLREDIERLLDSEVLEVHGSPTWTLEAHRQPTHSGESPLLTNKYLASSKHDVINGTAKWSKESLNPRRCSAPPVYQGALYYRPNRAHQYLSATELRDAAENDVIVKYGRPTRTTLLRARQRSKTGSFNAYEIRRELVQRMEEIKNGSIFSNPKDFAQNHTDIDGEPFHYFVTGARYNRAHCLDARSLTQYGVYLPRCNPLGWFVLEQRLAEMADGSPDSPRSDVDEGSAPVVAPSRPTTAPGFGRRVGPATPSAPRQAWGDASSSMHIVGADNNTKKHDEHAVVEEIIKWPQRVSGKGSRQSLGSSRGDNSKLDSRLPSVQGTSLSKVHRMQGPQTRAPMTPSSLLLLLWCRQSKVTPPFPLSNRKWTLSGMLNLIHPDPNPR